MPGLNRGLSLFLKNAVLGIKLGLGLTLTVSLTLKQHSLEKKDRTSGSIFFSGTSPDPDPAFY